MDEQEKYEIEKNEIEKHDRERHVQRRKIKQKRIRQIRKMRIFTYAALLLVLILAVFGFYTCNQKKPKVEDLETKIEEEKAEEQKEESVEEGYLEPEIDIVMVGDILLHDPVLESGKLADGTYNYDHLFQHVTEDIQAADIAIANQEVILGGTEIGLSGYPAFNGPYEVGDALVKAGFNVVLHATNHTLDRGKQALLNCMNFWKEKHSDVEVLGIFDSQEAYENDIYVYEKDGIKIAILNYTYGTNGIPVPEDMPYALALLDENKVISDIQKAKEQADFVVVCPHWGTEYEHTEDEDQAYWTRLFLEQGVDLVLGTHTHYIQPVEMLNDENGNQMLVYYSLGNFVNATAESGSGTADRMIGEMAQITVARKETGEVYIKEYGVEPLVTQLLYGSQEITTYKLSDYTEELAAQNKILDKDSAFSLDFCQNLCKKVLGELY